MFEGLLASPPPAITPTVTHEHEIDEDEMPVDRESAIVIVSAPDNDRLPTGMLRRRAVPPNNITVVSLTRLTR